MKLNYYAMKDWHVKLRSLLEWLEDTTKIELAIREIHKDDKLVCKVVLDMRHIMIAEVLKSHINNTWDYDPRSIKECATIVNPSNQLSLIIQVCEETIDNRF